MPGRPLWGLKTRFPDSIPWMKNPVLATVDDSGRLLLPESVREEAGILPGMALEITVQGGKIEIEPAPREVRIVQRGPLRVAVREGIGEPMTEDLVRGVRQEIRERES